MLTGESSFVHLEGDTGPAPLLEASLSRGAGGTTTESASIPLGVGGDRTSGLPAEVRTDGSGLIGGSLGPMSSMETRKNGPDKLGKGPIPEIQSEKVGLPEYHPPHPVLEEGESARVLLVHGNASGGGGIGSFVESPVSSGVPTAKCLVPGEVCLDPSDSGQLEAMACNDSPKVGMLTEGHDTGVQKEPKPV